MLGLSIAIATIVILGVVGLVAFAAYKLWQSWVVMVPPDQTAIIYGTHGELEFVRGRGRLVNKLTHRVVYLSHEPMTIPCNIPNILTADNHAVNIRADGVVRVGLTDEMRTTAASQWPGSHPSSIQDVLKQTIDGYARVVVSKLELGMLRSDMQELTRSIRADCAPVLANLGVELMNFTIQSLEDSQSNGGLALLADQQLAIVRKNVAIAKSDAEREAAVNTANNVRQSAEAQNATRTRVAQLEAETAAAEAKAQQAPLLAAAEAQKQVIAAEVANSIAKADGDNLMARNRAASGAQADAARRKIEAETQAQITATLAEADLTKALKEAEGTKALAEAQNTFSQQALLVQLLPQILPVLQAGFSANANALSNARITIVDSGNGGSSANLAHLGTNMAGFLELSKSLGLDLEQLLKHTTTPSLLSQNGKVEGPTELLPVASDGASSD